MYFPLTNYYNRRNELHYIHRYFTRNVNVFLNNCEKEPVFLFLMISAKQGSYWYHFYNVFGMKWSLTGDWTRDLSHSKPARYH